MAKFAKNPFVVTTNHNGTLRVPVLAHLAYRAVIRPAALPRYVRDRIGLRIFGRANRPMPSEVAVRLVRTAADVQTHVAPGLLSVDAKWASTDLRAA